MSSIIDDDSVIHLSQLLSQPLIATLEADFYTAQRFVEFITDFGLEEADVTLPGSSRPLSLKMVTFLYRQIDPVDRLEKLFSVQVPLISLIPLPLLQIERAEFDFNIRIYSEIGLSTSGQQQGSLISSPPPNDEEDKPLEDTRFRGFKARLSPAVGRSESGEIAQTLDANMKVKVQMRQADLPGGLAYWMSVFNNATSVNAVTLPQEDAALPATEESERSTPSE
jgi:hypothetical protein